MARSLRTYLVTIVVFSSIALGQALPSLVPKPCSCELVTVTPNPLCFPADNYVNGYNNLLTAICKTLCIFYPALVPFVGECCRDAIDQIVALLSTTAQNYFAKLANGVPAQLFCCVAEGLTEILTAIGEIILEALPYALATQDFQTAITYIQIAVSSLNVTETLNCAVRVVPETVAPLVPELLAGLKEIGNKVDAGCCIGIPDEVLSLLTLP